MKIKTLVVLLFMWSAYLTAMNQTEIDDNKLKSAGSIILVKHDQTVKILLGRRNKPNKNEDRTFSAFHGNIIRNPKAGIYDKNGEEAAQRNLVWEMMMLEGNPLTYPQDDVVWETRERQTKALSLIKKLKLIDILKNNNWEQEQRPNYVFLVDYEDIEYYINNFAINKSLRQSKWPAEISELKLFDAALLFDTIKKQGEINNGIQYGEFIEFDGEKLYDAFARTLWSSAGAFENSLGNFNNI